MIETTSQDSINELFRRFGDRREQKPDAKNGTLFDVGEYLREHGIEVVRVKQDGTGTIYGLRQCVFDASHGFNNASIIQEAGGRLLYQCFHDSCKGRTWHDARKIISGDEPIGKKAQQSRFPKLTWISRETLKVRPPDPEYLFSVYGQGLIPKNSVGAIVAAGGTGKSFILAHMAVALASGKQFGPFIPMARMRVVVLNAEDDLGMIGRRVWDITNGNMPEGLFFTSMVGNVIPVMELKNGNAARGDGYEWVDSILLEQPCDLLIIDPFSRFYGLDECNSSHGTAWVSALESLREKHGTTIIPAHHSNEESQKKSGPMDQTMLRGNSAFVSGYRFALGMRKMTDADAKTYGIEDRIAYVEIEDIKRNEGKALRKRFYLHQNEVSGVYEPFNPERSRISAMADALVDAIAETGAELSRRDLAKMQSGKVVSDMIADTVPGYVRGNDMGRVIDYCLEKGLLVEAEIEVGKTKKTVIMRDNGGKSDRRKTTEKEHLPPLSAYDYSEITAEEDFGGNEIFSTDNVNDFSTITAEKNHPLKGGNCVFPPFPSPGVLGTTEECMECSAHDPRRGYCIERADHPDSRLNSDMPCDKARAICRGPHRG